MKNNMFKFATPLALVMTLLMFSCQEDDLTDLNPNLESAETAIQNREIVSGQVLQYDCATDSWSSMPGVDVSINNCAGATTVSDGSAGNNYSLNVPNNCMSAGFPLCMEFDTPADHNVTTFDIVCLTKHILGTAPFTTARQYLAADVNRDGQITMADRDLMQQVILHIIPNFPNNNDLFIPSEDYDILQGLVDMGTVDAITLSFFGAIPNCLVPTLGDRHYIKTGDITGGGVSSGCGCDNSISNCITVDENCDNVSFEYCPDGTLTATFTGIVHYLKIWESGWQNSQWFCAGNNIVAPWNGLPPCTGTQTIQLDPTQDYFIELNGGSSSQYPGAQLCSTTWNINLSAW